MRAAVAWNPEDGFRVHDDVVRRAIRPDEVVLKIEAAGLCQTDIALSRGAFGQPMPVVLGHEGAGVVTEVGSAVSTVVPGQRAVVCWVPPCGACYFCLHHQPHLCAKRKSSRDSAGGPADLTVGDTPVIKGMGSATFAEETVLPATAVLPIPDDLPFEVAAVMGCALPTGIGAALHSGEVAVGDTVLVIGCGAVGLSAVQGALIGGATLIAAVDPQEQRRKLADRLGASATGAPEDVPGLREVTDVGFDVVIDAVGNSGTIRTAWDAARRGGRVVVVGAGRADDPVTFSANELFHDEKRLVGSFYGSCDLRSELPRMVALWRAGRLNVDAMLDGVVDLADINEAVERQTSGAAVRLVVRP